LRLPAVAMPREIIVPLLARRAMVMVAVAMSRMMVAMAGVVSLAVHWYPPSGFLK
jgi:hypothetical protein